MPDTLTPPDLTHSSREDLIHRIELLTADLNAERVHIDTLTAAVRRVEAEYDAVSGWHDTAYEGVTDALYAVLAVLRGEQDGAANFRRAVQRAFAGTGVEVRTSFTPSELVEPHDA